MKCWKSFELLYATIVLMSKISENILCAGDYMLDSAYAYGWVETETDMVIQITPFLPHSFGV